MKNNTTQLHKSLRTPAPLRRRASSWPAPPRRRRHRWGNAPKAARHDRSDQDRPGPGADPARRQAERPDGGHRQDDRRLTAGQTAQLTALGADITRRLPLIGSVALRLPTHNLAKLAALPFVSHLSSDGR